MNDEQTLEDALLKHDQTVPERIIDTPVQGDQLLARGRERMKHNNAVKNGYYEGTLYSEKDFEQY